MHTVPCMIGSSELRSEFSRRNMPPHTENFCWNRIRTRASVLPTLRSKVATERSVPIGTIRETPYFTNLRSRKAPLHTCACRPVSAHHFREESTIFRIPEFGKTKYAPDLRRPVANSPNFFRGVRMFDTVSADFRSACFPNGNSACPFICCFSTKPIFESCSFEKICIFL